MYSTQAQWMTAESDSQRHSSRTKQKKIAEAGSPHTAQRLSRRRWLSLALHTHTAQRLSEEDGWVWLSTHPHGSETQRRRWLSLAPHTGHYQDLGLSVGQDWVWLHNGIHTEMGKQLICWATRFLSAWILVSLWVTHQRFPSSVVSLATLDHAVWGLFSYRILASEMEGCFNDLHNSHPVTLYQWTTDTAFSCLLGLYSQCC